MTRDTNGWFVLLLVAGLLLVGCSRKEAGHRPDAVGVSSAPAVVKSQSRTATSSAAPVSAGSSALAMVHDPAHPPIDCPLRKHGIEPNQMRPFEDVAEYIEFLERPERAEWQKPQAVVAALGLRGNEVIFDVGAGSGYFSFRFAPAVASGRVIAADTEPEMIRYVHHRAMSEGVNNVEARLIEPTDPEVDSTADLVFVCDVLHHVADRSAWLVKIASAMKSGARLALIEFKEGKLPQGPPEGTKIPRHELLTLATGAGLEFEKEHEGLLPYQVFLEFRKP